MAKPLILTCPHRINANTFQGHNLGASNLVISRTAADRVTCCSLACVLKVLQTCASCFRPCAAHIVLARRSRKPRSQEPHSASSRSAAAGQDSAGLHDDRSVFAIPLILYTCVEKCGVWPTSQLCVLLPVYTRARLRPH